MKRARDLLKIKFESISNPGFELNTFLNLAPGSLAGDTLQKMEGMHDDNEASALTATYLVSSSQET